MTTEQKDLLLKDLCGRLPHGVKILVNDKVETVQGINILDNVIEYDSCLSSEVEEVKPYLFPLSSMTEEQLYELREMFGFEIEFGDVLIELSTFYRSRLGYLEMDTLFEWLNKNHFDYRGLIPKGLAIDTTNLNIY
jgi:hypothetical protein